MSEQTLGEWLCVVCKNPVPLDDTVVRSVSGRTVCERCDRRICDDTKRMSQRLMDEVRQAAGNGSDI